MSNIMISFCPVCFNELKLSGRVIEDGKIKEFLKCPICNDVKVLNVYILEK